jgi:uncharacterized membrane protein
MDLSAVAERREPPDVSDLRPRPAKPKIAVRTAVLAALLFVAGVLLVAGCWLVAPAAGLICAGVVLALWSVVVFVEIP